MSSFQAAKQLVQTFFDAIEAAEPEEMANVLEEFTTESYDWRGVYPYRQLSDSTLVAQEFWVPLKQAISRMQRRQDIFIAGHNEHNDDEVWVMSMGNFMGLFDADWLGIACTRRLVNLRYAEFNCVEDGKISRTGLFIDLIGLMAQAGAYPLPPSTGVYFNYPGPRTHDGLLYKDAAPEEGIATLKLVNRMVADLDELNKSGSMGSLPGLLERTWADDMLWYGPAGVGATYTIERYQEQHQIPFRSSLGDKTFRGHVCRFAEGNYACFFGWPNLSNSPLGGWLGLPGGGKNIEMQVVDVYRRDGDKLAENWVFIDIPWWLKQQGLDILERTRGILNS